MTTLEPAPTPVLDPVSWDDAAAILGCSRSQIATMVRRGILPFGRRAISREAVEQLAATSYDWRTHTHNQDGYWVTGLMAAGLVGVSPQRLRVLGDKGLVPYVEHVDGTRLYRREQLLTIANARTARWH